MKKLKDENLFRLIHDYLLVYLPNQKCCSLNTIKSYREALNQLFDFITNEKSVPLEDINFELINSQLIFDYLEWLEKDRHCSISTRNQRLAVIRSFFKYAGIMDITVTAFLLDKDELPCYDEKDEDVDFLELLRKSLLLYYHIFS